MYAGEISNAVKIDRALTNTFVLDSSNFGSNCYDRCASILLNVLSHRQKDSDRSNFGKIRPWSFLYNKVIADNVVFVLRFLFSLHVRTRSFI